MKATLLFPILALATRVVLGAVPPACLLSAVNTQDEPGDLEAICGDEAEDVQEAIASLCGDNASVAQDAFISTCSVAGSSVAPYTATATATATSSARSTATTTGGSNAIATSGSSASSGASASNTAGGASATGNAAADVKQFGSFAAAAIAIAGVVAVL